MTKTTRDLEVTERLREWIEHSYPSRGRFTVLEQESGLPSQRWKNVFYGRQAATVEMLDFVKSMNADMHLWVMTGEAPMRLTDHPGVLNTPTAEERSTLSGRVRWAAKECAPGHDADLFRFLERQCKKRVTASQWAALMLGSGPAEPEMIEHVCNQRPAFAAWIACGGRWKDFVDQVNPTNDESLDKMRQATWPADFDPASVGAK